MSSIGYSSSGTASGTPAADSSTVNSSGYVPSSFQAGQQMYRRDAYGEVRGYSKVPKVTCKGSDNFALWLGLNNTVGRLALAQAGVDVQCIDHKAAKYLSFYEMYPKLAQYPAGLKGKVRPGDELIVDVAYQLHGKYAISITDQRNSANFGNINQTFPKKITDNNRQALAIGERIQPGVSQPPVPKFYRILFSALTLRKTPTSSAEPFGHLGSNTKIDMENSNYTYPVVPSNFSKNGYAFYLYYY